MCCNFTYKKFGNITSVNNGQFYYGPNTNIFIFNITIVVLFSALAWGPGSPHAAVTAIGVIWGLLVLYYLLRCGLTDPGIIARKEDIQPVNNNNVNNNDDNQHQQQEVPKHQEVIVECKNPMTGKIVPKSMELTWCYTCQVQRPLRASHCRWCDCCIDRMDHHCPWTGTCIGSRNYRYFFGFVVATALYALFMIGTMAWSMKLSIDFGQERGLSGTDAFFEGMKEKFYYMPIVCMVVGIITIALVGGLATYHCSITAGDLTTHEDLRRYYFHLQSPFDRGGCTKNCSAVLCEDKESSVASRIAAGDAVPKNMVGNAKTVIVQVPDERRFGQPRQARVNNNNNANINSSQFNNNNNGNIVSATQLPNQFDDNNRSSNNMSPQESLERQE